MKATCKRTSIILGLTMAMLLILALPVCAAQQEMSLVTDTGDFAMSYGNAWKITAENDSQLIEVIRNTGGHEFKEGFMATFGGGYGGSSEQFLTIDDTKSYNKLIFDVCAITPTKFNDLEAYATWCYLLNSNLEGRDYDTFKKDFVYTQGTRHNFKVSTLGEGDIPPFEDNQFNIWIGPELGIEKVKYVVTASNDWNTVELDISDMDSLVFYISINGEGSMLIANPRLVSDVDTTQDTTPEDEAPVETPVPSNVFTDVPADAWYAQDVMAVQQAGIINGKGDGSFDPEGNLTVAQAIIMAAKVRCNFENDTLVTDGIGIYEAAVQYALTKGIIPADRFPDHNAIITRADMAYIFARALPETEYEVINQNITIPDVTEDAKEIYQLYHAGILAGSDEHGTFNPTANITRAESAAIINRLINKENRKTFELK